MHVEMTPLGSAPAARADLKEDFGEESFDDDLGWILSRFVEKSGARAVALIDRMSLATEPRLIHSIGLPLSMELCERLIRETGPSVQMQALPTPFDDSEGPCVAVVLTLAHDQHHVLSLVAIYPDQPESRQIALYAGARLEPVLRGYFKLWLLNRAQRRRIDGLASALNATDIAIFLLDGAGALTFTNQAGRCLIDQADGVRRLGNSIVATEMKDALRLRVAIDHVLAAPEQDLMAPVITLSRGGEARALVAAITRCQRAAHAPGDPAVIIYVFTPDIAVTEQIAPICQHHGLTKSEARLVGHLAEGRSVTEAAQAMRCAVPTVRTYLKQVFHKTGTSRQSELIRLVMASLARVRHAQQGFTSLMLAFVIF